jgi:hypothetical protein
MTRIIMTIIGLIGMLAAFAGGPVAPTAPARAGLRTLIDAAKFFRPVLQMWYHSRHHHPYRTLLPGIDRDPPLSHTVWEQGAKSSVKVLPVAS